MTCTKTGCHIFIPQYQLYAYGDAFELNSVACFRLVQNSRLPLSSHLHYTVITADSWFDKEQQRSPISTLISLNFTNHGYEGKPIP